MKFNRFGGPQFLLICLTMIIAPMVSAQMDGCASVPYPDPLSLRSAAAKLCGCRSAKW